MAQIEPDENGDYPLDWVMNNPIPAKCLGKCKRTFTEGERTRIVDPNTGNGRVIVTNEAIRSVTLECCRCFYCSGELAPLYPDQYRERLRSLGYNVAPVQAGLFA